MATLDMYIGSDGEVLLPLDDNEHPTLVSQSGTYYFPQTTELVTIEAGNPMGLLLTLTYPATP
jgi:hypothetical protein